MTVIPPFYWDNATDPVTTLVNGTSGNVHPIAGSPYFFRASRNLITAVNGGLRLHGSINPPSVLVIGGGNSTVSPNLSDSITTDSVHIPGQIDFTRNAEYKLTINYKDAVEGIDNLILRVSINNNTTAQAYSVLGAASNLRSYMTLAALESGSPTAAISTTGTGPGRLVLTFNPLVVYKSNPEITSLSNGFIGLTCFTLTGGITITGISLEQSDY